MSAVFEVFGALWLLDGLCCCSGVHVVFLGFEGSFRLCEALFWGGGSVLGF